METIRFNIARLKREELFELLMDFKQLVEKYGMQQLGISALFIRFLPLIAEADRLLKRIRGSSFTKPLQEAKTVCVRLFSGFYGTVKLARKQMQAGKKEKASHLYNGVKSYRKYIAKGGTAALTGAYFNLLQDLEGPLLNDITALDLLGWKNDMKTAHATHILLLEKRDAEKSALPIGDFKKVSDKAVSYYRHTLNTLDTALFIAGLGEDEVDNNDAGNSGSGEPFERASSSNLVYNFVVEWNIQARYYATLVAQRETRRAKKKAKIK